jgi:kynurenine---oxoglutarate transaminase / cysteine-S-conjugate beta-lyase / glutamine---phenylpyruvate transaminase
MWTYILQWVHYCVSTPTQHALAEVLKLSDLPYEGFPSYYDYVSNEYERKRNALMKALKAAEFKPINPEGGFFVVADTSAHSFPESFFLQVSFMVSLFISVISKR